MSILAEGPALLKAVERATKPLAIAWGCSRTFGSSLIVLKSSKAALQLSR